MGYIAEWRHPKSPKAPASPRLIIPTSEESYLARDTREQIPEDQKSYSKVKVGKIHLFNIQALKTAAKPIFVVEGEIDALSIMEVGGEAIALGTTTKIKSLIELLKTEHIFQPLILALDNDKAGEKAIEELIKGLQEQGLEYYKINLAGEYKDVNEALQHDKEAFRAAVVEVESIKYEAEQAQRENYLNTSVVHYLQSFMDGIEDSVNTLYIPTGFNQLDKALDGGLYEGLYIVGAITL